MKISEIVEILDDREVFSEECEYVVYLWKWFDTPRGNFWSRKTVVISDIRDIAEVINWAMSEVREEFDFFQLFIKTPDFSIDGEFRLLPLLGVNPNDKWSPHTTSSAATTGGNLSLERDSAENER